MGDPPFSSGKLSHEAYRQRMLSCTNEQLNLLMNDPKFHAWQAQKASRENRARSASNLLAAACCVLLCVTLALLKPTASGAHQVRSWRNCASSRMPMTRMHGRLGPRSHLPAGSHPGAAPSPRR